MCHGARYGLLSVLAVISKHKQIYRDRDVERVDRSMPTTWPRCSSPALRQARAIPYRKMITFEHLGKTCGHVVPLFSLQAHRRSIHRPPNQDRSPTIPSTHKICCLERCKYPHQQLNATEATINSTGLRRYTYGGFTLPRLDAVSPCTNNSEGCNTGSVAL